MKKTVLLFILLPFFFSSSLLGVEIFINDTNVTGIKDQKIENCTVKIDSEGNIHIEAKDVKIVSQSEKPENDYYVSISLQSPLSSDFVLSLNGKIVGKLDAGKQETLIELGDNVRKGENIVSYVTEPSKTPVEYTIMVGSGVKKGENLEFTPVFNKTGKVGHLGAAGNFKIVAE